MPLYLPVKSTGRVTVAICARCQRKFYLDDLVQDPNIPGLWVCKEDSDIYDPWRLPARQTEDISVPHPRPDSDISTTDNEHSLVPTP